MKKKILILYLLIIPSFIYSVNLIQLAEDQDLHQIKQAIQNNVNINMTDSSGFTALHVASWNGYRDIVQYLLENGANPNIISKAGNTPIKFAPHHIKQILKQYGAIENSESSPIAPIPRLLYSPNIYIPQRITPSLSSNIAPSIVTNISNFIENTVYVSNTYTVFDYPKKSYVVLTNISATESIALHAWDIQGNNSIQQAARDGDLEKIKELISKGINPKAKNVRGDTALRFAAENNHLDIVKYLLEEIGLDVNSANIDGTTALITAAFNNNREMIEYLGHMGANVNQTANANVQRTVNGEEKQSTIYGWTALMAAAQLGNNEAVEELIKSGANINALDSDRWNALLFAVQNDHVTTSTMLIQKGINYNVESKDKHTPLSLAIDNGNNEMIALLEDVDAISSSVPLVSYEESFIEVESTNETYTYEEDGYSNTYEDSTSVDGYSDTYEE